MSSNWPILMCRKLSVCTSPKIDMFMLPLRQYIHVQPFSMDAEKPDYDLDEEDTKFINQVLTNDKRFEIDFSTFEDMIDRLEKSSGQQIITAKEAKMLLKEDDDLILAVYDYWVEKRLRIKQPLLPLVKSDKRDLSHQSNSQNSSSGSGALNNLKQESGSYLFSISKLSVFFGQIQLNVYR